VLLHAQSGSCLIPEPGLLSDCTPFELHLSAASWVGTVPQQIWSVYKTVIIAYLHSKQRHLKHLILIVRKFCSRRCWYPNFILESAHANYGQITQTQNVHQLPIHFHSSYLDEILPLLSVSISIDFTHISNHLCIWILDCDASRYLFPFCNLQVCTVKYSGN